MSLKKLLVEKASARHKKKLTPTEEKVLGLIGLRFSDKEISAELGNMRAGTAHWHRSNIMRKLKIHREVELVKYAENAGFVFPNSDLTKKKARH